LSWAAATRVARAISSGSAKDCPAGAVLRRLDPVPARCRPVPARWPAGGGREGAGDHRPVLIAGGQFPGTVAV